MKTKKTKDLPLKAGVEGDQLVISIGIGTLAWASKKRNGGPLENQLKVINHIEFARDVANELCREDEVGNSMLAELLDQAMKDAADRGSTGLQCLRTIGKWKDTP